MILNTLADALDSHTDDNQAKRKRLRDRRKTIAAQIELFAKNIQQGNQALQGLYQSVEASLQLAEHGAAWSWKEAEAGPAKI